MAGMFNVSELVQVAVNDEKTGVTFYKTLAEKTQNQALAKTFADLSEQERYHQKRFEEMLAELGGYKSPDTYAEEYLSYLDALTRDRAFPSEDAAGRAARQCADDDEAIAVALRFERDTLVLMNEMRGMVRQKDRAIVDELIREEQQHVVDLTEARQKLKS